jgi:hypothetical protein
MMTWLELKTKIEALGVTDDTNIACIEIDCIGRRPEDGHPIRALTTPAYPGIAIVDDRSERRTLPGPGVPLRDG